MGGARGGERERSGPWLSRSSARQGKHLSHLLRGLSSISRELISVTLELKKVNVFSETVQNIEEIESGMIPAVEVTKLDEVVRVPGLGFLDKSAAEKLSDIFQV